MPSRPRPGAGPPRLTAARRCRALPPPLPARAPPRSRQCALRCLFPAIKRSGDRVPVPACRLQRLAAAALAAVL
ncbi:unnamed protein product [Rangifer tarandus platyrhynchus]|uniref:Uncharacterized protein n=2 Tax=Rangifer tarandus platyrhynchus TaxID=3082113 RepID=A0ABN8YSB7_RANTA|nr:unnamed protein product [Rangifer tarandus platyrhynchus]CAI9702112.1 unnamed protein product [Rangifer tarandus platyrhynchus]